MLKNSRKQPDALMTFSVWAVLFVLVKVLLMGVKVVWGTHSFDFGTIDALVVAAVLTPTVGAYTTKRIMLAPGGAKTEHPPETK
jgi:hypothetical protein